MRKAVFILLLLFLLAVPAVKAESPGPWWVKSYGGGGGDGAHAVAIAENGDIIVAGTTWSFGTGGDDVWVLRLDENGNVIWQKTYGGKGDDGAEAVAVAPNGDIIVAGWTESFGAGESDVWVLRLDANGNVKWQKTYGGSDYDKAYAVAVAPNGDIIVTGDFTMRLDANGNVIWAKDVDGNAVAVAPNGDIIVADGGYFRVLRLDANGNVKWQKIYSGDDWDEARAVAVAPNGDIIVTGRTGSFGAGDDDFWVLRLDANGNVKWQKTYGGSNTDEATAVAIAKNGDIIVAGYTYSFGAGESDVWVLRLDENGNVIWQKTYGGPKSDKAYAVAIAPNGDVIVAGETWSFGVGDWDGDVWVLRLPPDGSISWLKLAFASEFSSKNSNAEVRGTSATSKTSSAVVKDRGIVVKDSSAKVSSGDPVVETQYPSYQKLFLLAVAIVIGSAYTIHRRKQRERRIAKFNNLIARAEGLPFEEKLKLLEEARKLILNTEPKLAEKAQRLINIAKAQDLLSKAENSPLPEAIKLAKQALSTAKNEREIEEKAKEIISRGQKEFETLIKHGDELLAKEEYTNAIITYESLLPLAEALGKTEVELLNSKIQTAKTMLEQREKMEKLDDLINRINSTIARKEYSALAPLLEEAEKLSQELGEERRIVGIRENLKAKFESLTAEAEERKLAGDYIQALKLYTNALSLARILNLKAENLESEIRELEVQQKEDLLRKSIRVNVPTEMQHKLENEVSIMITNNFSEELSLKIDLSENADYFELSEERIEIPRLKPGKTIGESITVTPKFIGDFDFTIRINTNKGNLTHTTPVTVVKTSKSIQQATPTPLTSTPILNPVEALQELYSDFQYIGEGGFARVYKAKRKDGKVVALKIPKTLDPAVGRAFVREITNWLHLRHQNIVELYDVNVLPVPYLEMEYCEGSLARLQKPLPVDEASLIIFNIAEALKYAHSKKIVHRDLKPSNVLLKNGLPKISDWGLSKVLEESMSATTTASFTPFYAAPEQIDRKYGHTDERTDIWQLGVIFYELVTGRLPFEGSLSQVMMGILRDEPVPPSQLNPEAKKVEPIIMKMLAKRKEKRYQSVEELQRDLAKVLNMTYSESLKESKTLGDRRRVTYYLTELLLINLKTNNAGEAYKYASDLAFYVKGELREEVQKLADQVKFRLEENLEIPPELLEKAEIIVHKIRLGYKEV